MKKLLIKLFKKKEPYKLSKIDEVVISYRSFKPDSLNKVFSSDMSIIQISVCKSSVELYISYLRMLIDAFENEKQLSSYTLAHESKTVYLRDFFIDRNNHYLRPQEIMPSFIQLVIRFLELYQSKEQSLNKTFIIEKNLHLSSSVVTNLITLNESLSIL